MAGYILRRLLIALGTVWVISVISFAIIQLPPGDYVTSYIAQLMATGTLVTQEEAENLRIQYGLNQPIYAQYARWVWLMLQGNFGVSMEWQRPVMEVIGDRLLLTALLAFAAVIFTWILAIPIGIYSAVKQYSVGDYIFTFVGFIGLAVPSFLLALVVMYLSFAYFGASIGGLFSTEYLDAPWSLAASGTCANICGSRRLFSAPRARLNWCASCAPTLLDELRKPYVVTARAKGLSELRTILKYPVRVALNPVHQHHRLHPALSRLRQHHRLHRVEPAHGRAAAAEGPHCPGHVPGRNHCSAARPHDCHRHPDFRHSAGVDRPAHSVGGVDRWPLTRLPALDVEKSATADTSERLYVASQWQLMWWRFRKHRLAMAAGAVVALFYLVAIGADFLATTDPNLSDARRSLMPPQRIYWFDGWRYRPHVYAVTRQTRPANLQAGVYRRSGQQDPGAVLRARLFIQLPGPVSRPTGICWASTKEYEAAQTLFILGTDVQGRDLWSRLLLATRVFPCPSALLALPSACFSASCWEVCRATTGASWTA